MSSLLLVAAVTIRAAFPTFGVDGVPGRYSQALPDLFMSSVSRGGCAETIGDTAIDDVTNGALSACNGEPACVTEVSQNLVVDFVVLGSLRKEGTTFRMKLDVVDASRKSVAKKLEKSFDSLLNGVPVAIGELGISLCKVLQTQKPLVPAMVLAQRRAKKEPVKEPPPPAAKPAPADDLSLDFPMPPPAAAPAADLPLPPIEREPPPPVAVMPPPPPVLVVPLPQPVSPPPVIAPPPPPIVEATPPPMVGPPVPAPPPPAEPPAVVAAPSAPPAAPLPPEVMTPAPPGPTAGEVMRKIPWNWVLIGAAAVSTGVGVYYGSSSQAIWSRDQASVVGGVTQHTISRVDATQANKQAVNANISFAVAGALAAGGGVLFLVKF